MKIKYNAVFCKQNLMEVITMTKKEAVENHRKMWTWIALETLKRKNKMEKEDYFNEVMPRLKGKIFLDCFCCNYHYLPVDNRP